MTACLKDVDMDILVSFISLKATHLTQIPKQPQRDFTSNPVLDVNGVVGHQRNRNKPRIPLQFRILIDGNTPLAVYFLPDQGKAHFG